MASRTEIGVVYGAAIVQGLALVTFPAASSIFTSPDGFGFDSTRYGTMFVPQVALAILASALAPKLARRLGLRRVLVAGFAGNVVSMTLLAASALLLGASDIAFGILLLATAALGFGFGATVMALNTYAEAFFPEAVDRAVLALNALLGVGTALAPVLVAAVLALGAWWLLPIAVACVFVLIFAIASREPLRAESAAGAPIGFTALPRRFWLYAAAVFVYGILETLNGNWAILYLTSERGVSARGAAFALAAFWVMVTLGRVAIAMISRFVPARLIYGVLPIALFLTCQIASQVHGQTGGIIAFGLAGLACSAFLPLSISFGGKDYPELSAVMAGELIAFYQLGYGVAAFGIGPLHGPAGLALATIFAAGSLVAVPLVLIAYFIIRRPHEIDRNK
ncbi:MAG TPA: MFS transporter [Xanthobacteraceae bacterium]|jgi:MFS family permease|nr:MFS transporter [Xanthobacteraceae bacterium]